MRALVCRGYGDPEQLQVEDVEIPVPKEEQVLIKVIAAGVSYVDSMMIRDLHQNKHPVPFVPGTELTGRVVAAHPGSRFAEGDRVAALVWDGGHAEYAVANENEVFALPEGLDPVTVAACLSVYLTSGLALRHRAGLQQGEMLLVLGAAGGTGLAAVDIGHALGARVLAAASNPEKLALADQRGAEWLINYHREDLKEALRRTTPDGIDVVFDPVAGPLFEAANGALAWNGRYLIVGFTGGMIPQFAANRLLVKNRSALGFSIRHYIRNDNDKLQSEAQHLFTGLLNSRLHPHVSAAGNLHEAPGMIRRILDRKATGKMVVVV
ncbi:MAG: NADPH:quinone oxidoreductase family protein [Proteobacteria bacterium]|nr:MAG: NADPH:quinone oxidoreductase family protein [Pseudomonadota bacterium]